MKIWNGWCRRHNLLGSAGATILAAFIWGDSAHATVYKYSYTGVDYTSTSDSGSVPGAYTNSMDVTGYFTLSAPLAANSSANIAASILDWSFSDGRNTLTKAGQTSYPDRFYISTNAAGTIYAWTINLQAVANSQFNGSTTTNPAISSNGSSPSSFDQAYTTGTCTNFNSSYGGCFGYDADIGYVAQAGTWAATSIAETPLPASLPLMASGIGGLTLLVRRRRKRSAQI